MHLGGHMSVEPSESLSEVWTRWQGQVINTTFPLGRCLGSSDHSGVFLTTSTARGPADVAIKLVPTNRALAELLLPRWKRAGGLAHPNLLPLLQWGGTQLEGLPYLYALMEYADQTLAQLLAHRALTDDEAREMLLPTLDALAFLHGQDLVQGQLKPTNILVVGDQLKLSSDTVRRLNEGAISTHAPTPYDPPEARQGSTSPAGDIWALGVTLFEALTRRLPSGLGEPGEAPVLPADFSPAFRDVVARCLSPSPQERPGLPELAAFARGQSAESATAATIEIAALAPPESTAPESTAPESTTSEPAAPEPMTAVPMTSETVTIEPVTPAPATPEPLRVEPIATGPMTAAPIAAAAPAPLATRPAHVASVEAEPALVEESQRPRASLALVLGALLVIALIWGAVRVFSGHRAPVRPPTPLQAPVAPAAQTSAPSLSGTIPRSEAPPSTIHEVIPEVPLSARRTIRGHIKVWVRVIVNQDGSVFAATPDRAGSSRYFERLALEAAKKWTFPPTDTPARRIMQIRFDFSREGTTARAVALH
ncbi:MAG TPA: protein kinase [Steroidobacteraceae bacterium]|nr:protein kinase [Steroidobacteraceae bacterium]